MPCQAIVCLFVLLGLASCVLAAVRRGRASLRAAGLSAACRAALAFLTTHTVGLIACYPVFLSAPITAVAATAYRPAP